MTDLTPTLTNLLHTKNAPSLPPPSRPSPETPDEFLKEAYRINSHINSLKKYLQSIRHAYLSVGLSGRRPPSTNPTTSTSAPQTNLTDPDRDAIDTSTALCLRDLATSISNLSSAETLRQETQSTLLRKKYGHSAAGAALWRWAGGASLSDESEDVNGKGGGGFGKSPEQISAEESARQIKTVREGVLWFLRTGLETAASVQREMVEKRIERVREREKSVLYKNAFSSATPSVSVGGSGSGSGPGLGDGGGKQRKDGYSVPSTGEPTPSAAVLSEADSAQIESQLSPEQLQLFAEENDTMLRHYEDTLGKVQNAEKSLLEISSLQETLVTHLATQEEYISQLVSDVDSTQTNVGQGNKELKRATERRSTAQAVFWGTLGLCTWLVVWDLVF